jgi:spore germination cell wall hydrolase CwlJ-like protein
MFNRYLNAFSSYRLGLLAERCRRRVRYHWALADKGPWIAALAAGLAMTAFGFWVRGVFAAKDHERNLTCLARNVYFEARGEPVAGQRAVAEVTMNRVASGRYADSVCGVVYQKNWDPQRKRYVGAFSWTELDALPAPWGEEWQRAWQVAETVYYRKEPAKFAGALHFHATHIRPNWAEGRKRVARIGNHVFYR